MGGVFFEVYMKWLLILLVFSLTSCIYRTASPKFKIDDCLIIDLVPEPWEEPSKNIFKILQVGNKSYLMEWVSPFHMIGRKETEKFVLADYVYRKTECP